MQDDGLIELRKVYVRYLDYAQLAVDFTTLL